jgi:hypothetical protein
MRALVITTFALAVALVPAAALAQATTSSAQPPATTQATPPPAAPKVPFTSPAGILLVQIKPDQTAVFEEMVGKLQAGLAKVADETLKKQAAGLKIYKSADPFGTNALYVVLMDPTVPNSEYELFTMLSKTMTPDELRAPEAAAMWTKYQGAFAAGLSKLSLTELKK